MSLSFTPHLGMNSGSFNSRRILIELFESTFHQQRYLEASAALSRLYTEKPNEDVLGRIRKTLVNYLEKHPENFNAVEELLRLILSNDDEPGGAGIHPDWIQLSDETFQKAYEVHYDALTKKGVSEEAIAARIKLNLGIFFELPHLCQRESGLHDR